MTNLLLSVVPAGPRAYALGEIIPRFGAERSFASLRMTAAVSRYAHARKARSFPNRLALHAGDDFFGHGARGFFITRKMH